VSETTTWPSGPCKASEYGAGQDEFTVLRGFMADENILSLDNGIDMTWATRNFNTRSVPAVIATELLYPSVRSSCRWPMRRRNAARSGLRLMRQCDNKRHTRLDWPTDRYRNDIAEV
jgi:hypothetical protein